MCFVKLCRLLVHLIVCACVCVYVCVCVCVCVQLRHVDEAWDVVSAAADSVLSTYSAKAAV